MNSVDSLDVFTDCIIWGNSAAADGDDMYAVTGPMSLYPTISYSIINSSGIYEPGTVIVYGPIVVDADPLFATGPKGDYYLSHVGAGQGANSPGLDAGSDPDLARRCL